MGIAPGVPADRLGEPKPAVVVAVAVAVLAVTGGPILLSSIVAVVPLVAVAGIAAVGAGEGVIQAEVGEDLVVAAVVGEGQVTVGKVSRKRGPHGERIQ